MNRGFRFFSLGDGVALLLGSADPAQTEVDPVTDHTFVPLRIAPFDRAESFE